MARRPKVLTSLAVLLWSAAAAEAGDTPAPLMLEFPPGAETCYGHTYDAAHLARHPRQRMVSLFVLRSLTDDPAAELPPRSREEIVRQNLEGEAPTADPGGTPAVPAATLDVLVRFRDRPGMFRQMLECHAAEGDGVRCIGGCEGGSINVKGDKGDLAVHMDYSLRVASGCASNDGTAPEEEIIAADDGHDFRLSPLPASDCLAARDRARPDWAKTGAEPLRQRFARPGGLCLVSKMGKTGLRKVSRISVRTTGPVTAADDGLNSPMVPVELTARLTGDKIITRSLSCVAFDYEFSCGTEEAIANGFRLTQAPGETVTLRDRDYQGGEFQGLLGFSDPEKIAPVTLEAADMAACTDGGR